MAIATLAGGCFWCLEAVFQRMKGVEKVVSGYMGGKVERPSYEMVCNGDTGHAEVVQVSFDPAQVDFRELLDVFFAIHDPTQLNRQGNDVGTQYRSAVFCHDETQKDEAEAVIAQLKDSGEFRGPIVTEIAPVTTFWPAEGYHQDYFNRNGHAPYCEFVVAPKVSKFLSKYSDKVKS
jgi:peptide-methionine (S)-S-oxide reductase